MRNAFNTLAIAFNAAYDAYLDAIESDELSPTERARFSEEFLETERKYYADCKALGMSFIYSVRAYSSRKAAERGELPQNASNTNCPKLAAQQAETLAMHYGAAVMANNGSGDRTWFEVLK